MSSAPAPASTPRGRLLRAVDVVVTIAALACSYVYLLVAHGVLAAAVALVGAAALYRYVRLLAKDDVTADRDRELALARTRVDRLKAQLAILAFLTDVGDDDLPSALHRPERGSDVEAWIKRRRDARFLADTWDPGAEELDDLLDDYRLRADAGLGLGVEDDDDEVPEP